MSEVEYYADIAEHVKKGTFYKQASDWYVETVATSVTERSYMMLFMGICVFIIIYAMGVIWSFTPLSKEVPVTIRLTDLTSEYSKLVPLISKDYSVAKYQDPDTEIQGYLLKNYVSARETYDSADNFNLLNRNILYVREFSTSTIATSFENALDLNNPSSPRIRFRDHTKRIINIKQTNISIIKVDSPRKRLSHDGQPLHTYTANVTFSTQEVGSLGTLDEEWKGRIDFLYSPVSYNSEIDAFHKIEFRVMNYQIVKVK